MSECAMCTRRAEYVYCGPSGTEETPLCGNHLNEVLETYFEIIEED